MKRITADWKGVTSTSHSQYQKFKRSCGKRGGNPLKVAYVEDCSRSFFLNPYFSVEKHTLNLPKIYVELLDDLVKEGLYANRSLAITAAVRDLLILHQKWPPPPKKP